MECALVGGSSDYLWLEWLGWRSRDAKSEDFHFDKIIKDCIRSLGTATDEHVKLAIFWRLAVILRDAGKIPRSSSLTLYLIFSRLWERATAMMQAQCEL